MVLRTILQTASNFLACHYLLIDLSYALAVSSLGRIENAVKYCTINTRHYHLRKLFYTYRIGHLSVADKMAETKTVSFPFMRNLIGMEVDDDSMKAIPYAKVWHIP